MTDVFSFLILVLIGAFVVAAIVAGLLLAGGLILVAVTPFIKAYQKSK